MLAQKYTLQEQIFLTKICETSDLFPSWGNGCYISIFAFIEDPINRLSIYLTGQDIYYKDIRTLIYNRQEEPRNIDVIVVIVSFIQAFKSMIVVFLTGIAFKWYLHWISKVAIWYFCLRSGNIFLNNFFLRVHLKILSLSTW